MTFLWVLNDPACKQTVRFCRKLVVHSVASWRAFFVRKCHWIDFVLESAAFSYHGRCSKIYGWSISRDNFSKKHSRVRVPSRSLQDSPNLLCACDCSSAPRSADRPANYDSLSSCGPRGANTNCLNSSASDTIPSTLFCYLPSDPSSWRWALSSASQTTADVSFATKLADWTRFAGLTRSFENQSAFASSSPCFTWPCSARAKCRCCLACEGRWDGVALSLCTNFGRTLSFFWSNY